MDRIRLARLIWKLWKRRNYYKYWYEYERESNNVWMEHIQGKSEGKSFSSGSTNDTSEE